MATVYVGSAAIDERGKATGGAAGDQTGRELRTQAWYMHSLGWVVIRARSAAVRAKIAAAMRAACLNARIGYDQGQRDTLYNVSKQLGFDPAKVTTPCECDCSSLVRVCCAFAGIMVASFRTYNEPAVLKATGQFDVLTDKAYTNYPDRLLAGDILCTPQSGHTVVVLNDGDKAYAPLPDPVMSGPIDTQNVPWLKFGSKGNAVAYMQMLLAKQGSKYALPKSAKPGALYGYDGIWKTTFKITCETERVFRQWQKDVFPNQPKEWDGICGPKCWSKLTGQPCK